MVFPETKEIILEAQKQYLAFEKFCVYLEKRVDALVKRKIANFGETTEGIRKANLEIKEIEDATRRRQLNLLQLKAKMLEEPMFSPIWEAHMKKLTELRQYLKPFEESIVKLVIRIGNLKQEPEKARLLLDVQKAQNLYESVVWLLMKASLYEEAHKWQESIIQKRLADTKRQEERAKTKGFEFKVIPLHEGYFRTEDRLTWRKLAETEFKRRQQKYFENLEKIQNKPKEDQKK